MIRLPVLDNGLPSGPDLIRQLLAEQQALTAVERFSDWHSNDDLVEAESRCAPVHAGARYASLLPATPPATGQQYAFEVDLDRCSGCKACVVACHSLNGLDDGETWRDVGLMVGGGRATPVMQHVTSACHHCLKPACLAACPVNAYEKDLITGIVKHLDDQCFGCQYCTMACPYDVPKYHAGKGIVRKCDMCSSRLAAGEPPACVQSCPHQAITIRVVDVAQVVEDAETSIFLPAAPDPQITLPTTTYKSRRPFPRNLLPADYYRVNPQHAHWPLVVMLVLTQLSVGAFSVGLILEQAQAGAMQSALRSLHACNALVFGLLALAASLFHLGRPHLAFRAVLGLRHSWLSREIIAFGAFAFLACFYAAAMLVGGVTTRPSPVDSAITTGAHWLGWAVVAAGIIAVYCSTMIYVFTQRECWSFARTAIRFVMTGAILGLAAAWLSILLVALINPTESLFAQIRDVGPVLCRALIVASLAKLLWEAAIFRHHWSRKMTALRRSAMLLTGDLSSMTLARFALGLLGGVILPMILRVDAPNLVATADLPEFVVLTGLLFCTCLAGELLERYLFFAACAAPRMPGGIR